MASMLPSLPPGSTPSSTIQEGSLVIVYENINSMKAVYVSAKGTFDNKFGCFPHKDWLGLPYGSKVFSKGGSQGWVYLLAPTVDLWTNVLRHRTQILYVADISMAVSYLDLRPGCVVLESGTGSGSLTHSLVRAVAPTGHVHTFEFHPERAEEAAKEFARHGLTSCVTVRQRNIEELGFPRGGPEEAAGMINLQGAADAVFLDLPGPYKVVESAAACLRPDGRFCSFSPCIEQVQKTCEALECNGFTDIQTLECLLRVHEVRTEHLAQPQVHLAPSTAPAPAAAAAAAAANAEVVAVGTKRAREEGAGDGDAGGEDGGEANAAAASDEATEAPPAAELASGQSGAGDAAPPGGGTPSEATTTNRQPQPADQQGASRSQPGPAGRGRGASKSAGAGAEGASRAAPATTYTTMVTSRPAMEARGHTGYLTFARKFVGLSVKSEQSPQADEPA